MKKRSHVLHELLAGCVQRKDIECLRQHLTPKHEYVLFVRLSPLQVGSLAESSWFVATCRLVS